MIASRRSTLPGTPPHARSSHAGLWLDKYLAGHREAGDREDQTPQQALVDQVAQLAVPPEYTQFYVRWEQALGQQQAGVAGQRVKLGVAEARGRLVIGLGAESVLETAVTLHRTYGVPFIPGRALKGLTAAYTRQRLGWDKKEEVYRVMFGDTAAAGYLTFFDALYDPASSAGNHPLYADVITVHHPEYYQQGNVAPADWDSPNPVPFLSAAGRYLVALAGPGIWVDSAWQLLAYALADLGIGAKTSSGYGRMDLRTQK
jgi:CRISPR-associated protein Cmr6